MTWRSTFSRRSREKNGRRTRAPAAGRVYPITRSVRPPRVRRALGGTVGVGPAWLISALTLGLLALTLPLAARGLYGPPGAWVHIRWQPSVDTAERQRLETALRLVDGQVVAPTTWRYDLTDFSAHHIRAVVEHPAVEDTHYIDRQQYTLDPEASRTARRHGLIAIGGGVAVGIVDRVATLFAGLAGLIALVPIRVVRRAVTAVARWMWALLGVEVVRKARPVVIEPSSLLRRRGQIEAAARSEHASALAQVGTRSGHVLDDRV